VNRRKLLQSTVGVTALGLTTSTVSARDEGELPNENLSVSNISKGEVPAGDWLHHQFGWVEFCKSAEENARRAEEWIDSTELLDVSIGGESIENPNQYYATEAVPMPPRIDRGEDARWVPFSYYTPPKAPGEYTFSYRLKLTDHFLAVDGGPEGDRCSENGLMREGNVREARTSYVVKPSKGRKR